VKNFLLFVFRWPLIVDTSGQAATFLRYRDTNYINALSPRDVEPERIRLSILGALRSDKCCCCWPMFWGRPKRTWREVVQKDCQTCKLNRKDAIDRSRWRKLIKDGWWSG